MQKYFNNSFCISESITPEALKNNYVLSYKSLNSKFDFTDILMITMPLQYKNENRKRIHLEYFRSLASEKVTFHQYHFVKMGAN